MDSDEKLSSDIPTNDLENGVSSASTIRVPWYRKCTHAVNKMKWLVIVIVLLIVNILIMTQWQHLNTLDIEAGSNQASLSIQPISKDIPPESSFQVWVTADNPIAFVRTEITFDPGMLKLTQEPALNAAVFDRIIRKSTMAEANTTGIIHFSVAVGPTNRTLAPSGTFQLATLNFTANTTTQNDTTTINIPIATTTIVNPDASLFTVTSYGVNVNLNVSDTPILTPTPGPSPTPSRPPSTNPTDSIEHPTHTPDVTQPHRRKTTSTSTTKGVVWGKTVDTKGHPVSGADIKISSQTKFRKESDTTTLHSDAKGAFTMYLPYGKYTVTIQARGYSNQTQIVTISENRAETTVYLRKRSHFSFSRHFPFVRYERERD